MVQDEARVLFMRVLIEMIDPAGVETASTTLDPMHLIAAFQVTVQPNSYRPGR